MAKIEAFRRKALAASDFQQQKDDPLSRMTAYQELKKRSQGWRDDLLFSWMTRFLVIFLEIVPVVAKMFFSPPSVYAARFRPRSSGSGRRCGWRRKPPGSSRSQ